MKRAYSLPEILTDDTGISTAKAGELLGCSARQIRRLIDNKELDGYRLGPRDWRTTPRACREFQQRGGAKRKTAA